MSGQSVYVGGQAYTVRVNYNNSGTLDAMTVDGVLMYNGYSHISSDNPGSILVSAGSTAYQQFTITVSPGATTAVVIFDCIATGLEETTLQPISVISNDNDLHMNVQAQAQLGITSVVDRTGTAPYWRGETFSVRVTIQNSGGTNALNVDSTLSFNGYSQMSTSNPSPVLVSAGLSAYQDFTVTVGGSATTAMVEIDALATGSEEFTFRVVMASTNSSTDLHVQVGQEAAVLAITSIQDMTGHSIYYGGETIVIRVMYSNTGLWNALNVDGVSNFNGYTFLSASNPAPVLVSACSTAYQEFTITVSAGATTAAVTIDCDTTGTEQFTMRTLYVSSNANDLHVNVQAQAQLSITDVVDMTGTMPYWQGETFTIRITYQNNGGIDTLNVDSTLSFNGYAHMTASDPAPVVLAAGSSAYQDFTVTIGVSATAAIVEIDATTTGNENGTGRELSTVTDSANDLHVQIGQDMANLTIISIQDFTGNGTYVGGGTFVIRVTYSNSGELEAQSVDGILDFNGYTFMTSNNPAPVLVSAGSTAYQEFTILLSAGATTGAITIDCNATGIEELTMQPISALSNENDLHVNVQAQAQLNITIVLDTTATAPYWRGETFTVRITYQNNGGTDVLNADSILSFSSYAYLSASNPVPVLVAAGSSAYQDFIIAVGMSATTAMVEIDAAVIGHEQYTGRVLLNVTDAANDLHVQIGQENASLAITSIQDMTGNGTYVGGEMFVIRVTYNNTGLLDAQNVDGLLYFNGYLSISTSNPLPVTVPAGSIAYQEFTVTFSVAATTATVTIDCNATGIEELTMQPVSALSNENDLHVTVQAQAQLNITSVLDITGNAPYWRGETFTVRVTYHNGGGTDALNVDSTLNFNSYAHMTTSDPVPVVVSAGSSAYQDFTVTVRISATTAMVEIDAMTSGNENNTGRLLETATGSNNDLHVQITYDLDYFSVTISVDLSFDDIHIDDELTFYSVPVNVTGLIIGYLWDFGDGTTSTLESPVHAYDEPGTYQIFLTVLFDNGMNASASHDIIVKEPENDGNSSWFIIIIIVVSLGSVFTISTFSYKRVRVNRKNGSHLKRKIKGIKSYVDPAVPMDGVIKPEFADQEEIEAKQPVNATDGSIRRMRVFSAEVLEYVNRLSLPSNDKDEILGEIKDLAPDEQLKLLNSIFKEGGGNGSI
nr:PKD domain-containing protein [Candidatus Sigynarchaeota archaeon]